MAEQETITLGIVGIENKGEYDSETEYERLNVVTYQGSTYCATQNTKGNLPTNTDYWQLYAQKGDTGDTGPQGNPGPQGIQGVPGGKPLVANSVSDMTDTTSVYVNTTDGHWYSYDGEAWQDGGVYQSTAIADNTVVKDLSNLSTYSLTDIFRLFQAKSLEWRYAETANFNDIRICTNRVHFKAGDKIYDSNSKIYYMLCLCDEYGLNNSNVFWRTTSYTFLQDTYVYMIFKYINAGVDEEWDNTKIEELKAAITFEKENSINEIPLPHNYLPEELVVSDYSNVHFINGTLQSQGIFQTATNRILTKEYFVFDNQKNSVINTNTSSIKYAIHCFNFKGEKIFGSGWVTDKKYIIPKCDLFRLQIAFKYDTVIDPINDAYVYDYLRFKPSVPTQEKQQIANDFQIEYGRINNTSYTFVRIPHISASGKSIKPKVAITTDSGGLTDIDTVKAALTYSKYNSSLFVINAGIFNPDTKEPLGQIIIDGESIQDETAVRPVAGTPYSDGEVYPLCIDENGNLSAPYGKTVTTSIMINEGVKYAVVGWIKLIDNFNICTDDIAAEVIHRYERLPQQIIGQYQNGDYFVLTSDGVRGSIQNESGLIYTEMANLLVSKGVKFAYALDGGGSAETVKELRQLNPIYSTPEGRTIPTVISFEIED